jgi:hypothetical protein
MLDSGNLKAVSELLPRKVAQATKEPPICDVIKITGQGAVVRFVEFELVKMSALVSVGNNLSDLQVQFIATQLVEMFPNESLVDFKLCFERGCIGQYGEIFRMDGIVLRKWMERYLEEKYEVIEYELKRERVGEYEQPIPPSEEGPGYREFVAYANSLREGSKVPGMTDADHRKYGHETPVRKSVTSGMKYFKVKEYEVFASTQEHAEELFQKMIDHGMLK